jgi:hypothetical protein
LKEIKCAVDYILKALLFSSGEEYGVFAPDDFRRAPEDPPFLSLYVTLEK